MNKRKQQYDRMNVAALSEATREYDRELPLGQDGLPGRPMNAVERKQWSKVRRKMGRPRLGKGARRVMISMEAQLLKQSDNFARKHNLNRSQMISAGLRLLMAG